MRTENNMKIGAMLSYGSMVFNAVAGVLYTPWMIRCIGQSDYGLYTLSLSLVNMFLIDFGLGQAVVRYLARYYAKGEDSSVPKFLGMVYKIYMIIALVLCAVYFVIYLLLDKVYAGLTASELLTLKPLFLISALYSVSLFPCMPLEGILTAREEFIALNGCTLIWKVTTVLTTVAALLLGYGVLALVVVNAVSGFLFALAKLLCVKRLTVDRADLSSWDGELGRDILGFTTWQMIVQITENLTTTLTPSILAATVGSVAVTIIGVAIQINGYVYQIASVINKMLMASTARILELVNSEERLQEQLEKVGRFQLVSMGLILVLFISLGSRIIDCWLGDGYEGLLMCVLLVLLPTVLRMSQSIADSALMLEGYVKERGVLGITMLLCVVAVSVISSPSYGAIGAAFGLCVGGIARAVGLQKYSASLLGISSERFVKRTFGRWVIPAFLASLVGRLGSISISDRGWVSLLLLMLITTAVYVISCWLLAFDKDDRARALSIIRMK